MQGHQITTHQRRRECRRIIPDPTVSDREHARMMHTDLPDMTTEELAAERLQLAYELSRRVFQRERDRYLSDCEMTEREWLNERIARLRSEERQRGRNVA